MNQLKKRTAIKALLLLALMGAGALACAAQVAGTVIHLSGPLMAKKADGTAKILSVKSEVEQGDTLVTEKNTYAQIKFIDNSEITLRPGTSLTVEAFTFDAGKPDGDSASFNLLKGGLRSITGLLGKRSKERFSLKTPTATIGIRGTTFIAQFVPVQVPGGLAPGLHVQVIDGLIHVSNTGGTQNFAAGQFGFTPSLTQPPVIVPNNPGIQFTPPPAFGSASGPVSSTSASVKSSNVDCEVR